MEEIVQLVMKTYGLVGLLLLSPLVAVVYLWKQNQALQKQLNDVQTARTEDSKAVYAKLLEVLTEQSSLNKETNMVVERMSHVVEINSQLLNSISTKVVR